MVPSTVEKMKPAGINEDTSVTIVNNRNTYLAAISALMYIFVMGMLISYTAPATVDMQKPGSRLRGLTADQITWMGSLTTLGGIPGNILAGYFSHKFGRKAVLMFSSPLLMAGWLMVAYATTPEWVYAGRLTSGFCTGLYVVAVPAYVSEIASQEIRGLLSSGFTLANNLGMLVMLGLGIKLRWTWLAVSAAITTAAAAILMLFMPESPPWLVRQSRIKEAEYALKFLRGKQYNAKKEIQDIVESLAKQEVKKVSFRDFLAPDLYKPILISLAFMFFYATSGINPLIAYSVEIFQRAGSAVDPTIAATIIGVVQVISSVICGILIDRSGRRKLYITSGILTTISLGILGVYSIAIKHHATHDSFLGYIPLITFIVYVFSFSFGLGSVPFVMMPEMIRIQYRSTVLSIATVFVSLCAFIVLKIFDVMLTYLRDYGLYWTYSFFTFLCVLFGYFLLPETKQLTIEEISESFSKSKRQT